MTSSDNLISKILNNEVEFELSKRGLKEPINKLYIYQRKPIGKVVLCLHIDKQYYCNPIDFFGIHDDKLGYSRDEFIENYGSFENIHFYHFNKVEVFNSPISLEELGKKAAPQSIQYIPEGNEFDNK